MSRHKWTRIDCALENPPCWLDLNNDFVLYMHEKLRGNYQRSSTNQKIHNFKHPVERRDTSAWKYKLEACEEFAADLAQLDSDICVASIPTSKSSRDPDFDPRFHMLFENLRRLTKKFTVMDDLIVRTESTDPLHVEDSKSRRHPESILRTISISHQPPVSITRILLVDDVITSGASYKACEQLIHRHYPDAKVYGAFWARMIHES